MFLNVKNDDIIIKDNNNQQINFFSDGYGDYYFTLYTKHEARSGDGYKFIIEKDSELYKLFELFVEQEIDCLTKTTYKSAYFIINKNSVKLSDQV